MAKLTGFVAAFAGVVADVEDLAVGEDDGWWGSVDAGVGCRVDSLLVLVSEESVVHVTKKWPVLGGQFGGTPG